MERTQLIKKSSRYNLYLPSLTTSNVESADRAQQEEREPAQLRVYQASCLPRFQSDFWAIGTWSRTIRPASGNAIATRRNVIIRLELIPAVGFFFGAWHRLNCDRSHVTELSGGFSAEGKNRRVALPSARLPVRRWRTPLDGGSCSRRTGLRIERSAGRFVLRASQNPAFRSALTRIQEVVQQNTVAHLVRGAIGAAVCLQEFLRQFA